MKGQQLMDLENKLRVAKEELEKAALDKVRRETIKSFFHYKLFIFQDQPVLRCSLSGLSISRLRTKFNPGIVAKAEKCTEEWNDFWEYLSCLEKFLIFYFFSFLFFFLSWSDLGVPAEGFEGHGPYLLLICPTNPDGGFTQAAGHALALDAILSFRQ